MLFHERGACWDHQRSSSRAAQERAWDECIRRELAASEAAQAKPGHGVRALRARSRRWSGGVRSTDGAFSVRNGSASW